MERGGGRKKCDEKEAGKKASLGKSGKVRVRTIIIYLFFFWRGGRSGVDGERGRGEDGWVFSAVRCGVVVLPGCVCNREEGGATTCEAPD